MTYTIQLPDLALVALIGVSGSGKSTFARRHFLPSEVLSSDAFRGFVSDDENDQAATADAFDVLHYLAGTRLRRRKLVVVDATNVQPEARRPLLELAARHNCLAAAIVLNVPERVCLARNQERPDRQYGPHVVMNQGRNLRQSLRALKREGFRYVWVLDEAQIEAAQIERIPLWTDRRGERGPFDIVGDVHGCYGELKALLEKLCYAPEPETGVWRHPEGRRAVFLGDLVDRGPEVVEAVRLVRAMTLAGHALTVPGNHDVKLARALKGGRVSLSHGLAESLEQIEALPEAEREAFKQDCIAFVEGLVSHFWLDGGALCVAHAGMKEEYIGRASGRVRDFALYGDPTGETDEVGLPIRYPWAEEYHGATTIVYGHTPTAEAQWLNNTINIDTGCVFGGSLTALRWPEREIVQVASATPAPGGFGRMPSPGEAVAPALSLQWEHDALLRAEDVLGKRYIETRLAHRVMVPAENAAASLEVMSRFAADPRWLIYLPPTMSPCQTAAEGDLLERPAEAFSYYREQGVKEVVCQRKHMGSRVVLVVCRDETAARRRFGAETGEIGQCVTRTGRPVFDDRRLHSDLLAEVAGALTRADFWNELDTDWVCLDAELMPWNAKAQALLREQYAPVGAAAQSPIAEAIRAIEEAGRRGLPVDEMLRGLLSRQDDVARYRVAYARYCWEVQGLADLNLAPFHLLATEGRVHFDRDHTWHMETLARLAGQSDLLIATDMLTVDTEDEASQRAGMDWWQALTGSGGEGMVVKPRAFVARGSHGLAQPAVKVRGREYLRIIYGPEYTEPANLERLRRRGLGRKRSLALREFALGAEALERFVRHEPLRRVHECVFGVLALESEPVDPRL